MLPGSLLLCVLLAVLGQCLSFPNKTACFNHNATEEDTGHVQSCGRIMSPSGGTEFKYIEFPWVVALFATHRPDYCGLTSKFCWFKECSGSLISMKVVLLSADCVYNYNINKLKVRAGYRNLETIEAQSIYQEKFVNKKIIHPLFHQSNPSRYERNNAALLVMESSYTLDNMAFICLPPPNINIASTSCKVAGWDLTRSEMDHYTIKLFDFNYMDHDECQRILIQKWGLNYVLHDSYMCASCAMPENFCYSQHGAPLMCIAEDHYYARGISSWGFDYNNANTSVVHMDVVKARSWIDQEMRANGFTTDTYTHVADRKLTAIN